MKHTKCIIFLLLYYLPQFCNSQSKPDDYWIIENNSEETFAQISERLEIKITVLKELNKHLNNEMAYKGDTIFLSKKSQNNKEEIKITDSNESKKNVSKINKKFQKINYLGKKYLIFEVDPKKYKIELFNRLQNNNQLYNFNKIAEKKDLVFAMNGGMYEQDFTPVGLYIADGKTYNPVNVSTKGKGNFYELLPNGLFMIDSNNVASVIQTKKLNDSIKSKIKLATQSGPLLVINGIINTTFNKDSQNINIRNGVGINNKKNIVFVISLDEVNFYEFSQLYKDVLKCPNALYLDGAISQYFIPEIQKKPSPGPQLGIFITVSKISKEGRKSDESIDEKKKKETNLKSEKK